MEGGNHAIMHHAEFFYYRKHRCTSRTRRQAAPEFGNSILDYEQSLFFLSPSNKTRENAHMRD